MRRLASGGKGGNSNPQKRACHGEKAVSLALLGGPYVGEKGGQSGRNRRKVGAKFPRGNSDGAAGVELEDKRHKSHQSAYLSGQGCRFPGTQRGREAKFSSLLGLSRGLNDPIPFAFVPGCRVSGPVALCHKSLLQRKPRAKTDVGNTGRHLHGGDTGKKSRRSKEWIRLLDSANGPKRGFRARKYNKLLILRSWRWLSDGGDRKEVVMWGKQSLTDLATEDSVWAR